VFIANMSRTDLFLFLKYIGSTVISYKNLSGHPWWPHIKHGWDWPSILGTHLSSTTHTPHTLLNTCLVLSKKKPTAGSSQIKNAVASRIDLSTDDHDEKLLSFFAWQPLLGIAEIHYIFYIFCVRALYSLDHGIGLHLLYW
jgi:hypothetical protein